MHTIIVTTVIITLICIGIYSYIEHLNDWYK